VFLVMMLWKGDVIKSFAQNDKYNKNQKLFKKKDSLKEEKNTTIKFDVLRLFPEMIGIEYGNICFGVEKKLIKTALALI